MILQEKILTGMLLLLGVCLYADTALAARHVADETSHTTVNVETATASEGTTLAVQPQAEGTTRVVEAGTTTAHHVSHVRRRPVSHTMHQWPVESRDQGGTLLFSDSPEYVAHDGILYQDVVSGDARVLYYHLNNQQTDKKVAVVLESVEEGFTSVRITRGGYGLPSDDYLAVGKASQMMYYGQEMSGHLYMVKNSRRLLDQTMDKTILHPGQLVCGVYDFTTNHPVRVTVVMYPANVDLFVFLQSARVQPKDEMRLRGTFKNMDRVLTGTRPYDPAHDGMVYIPLADNVHDLYRTGIDATDGSAVTDYGNYGINYYLRLPVVGEGGAVKYFLNPLGGVYAGAMTVALNGGHRDMLQTPFGRTFFGDATPPETESVQKAREAGLYILTKDAELADLGTYDADDEVEFEFSPPGASNLPANVIMMPAE